MTEPDLAPARVYLLQNGITVDIIEAALQQMITEAPNYPTYELVNIRSQAHGYERWPQRTALDFITPLCRWCAKELTGRQESWCSKDCEAQVRIRCFFDLLRPYIFKRDGGRCVECGIDCAALRAAFQWYFDMYWRVYQRLPGGPPKHWPTAREFREVLGFASGGHTWEINHKKAIAEGGNPVDPANLETLCLRCHRKHTGDVVGRKAKERRLKKRYADAREAGGDRPTQRSLAAGTGE